MTTAAKRATPMRSENMKMAGIACITFAVIVFAVNIAHAYTDSEVSDQIDDAFSYEDNPRMARGGFLFCISNERTRQ